MEAQFAFYEGRCYYRVNLAEHMAFGILEQANWDPSVFPERLRREAGSVRRVEGLAVYDDVVAFRFLWLSFFFSFLPTFVSEELFKIPPNLGYTALPFVPFVLYFATGLYHSAMADSLAREVADNPEGVHFGKLINQDPEAGIDFAKRIADQLEHSYSHTGETQTDIFNHGVNIVISLVEEAQLSSPSTLTAADHVLTFLRNHQSDCDDFESGGRKVQLLRLEIPLYKAQLDIRANEHNGCGPLDSEHAPEFQRLTTSLASGYKFAQSDQLQDKMGFDLETGEKVPFIRLPKFKFCPECLH